MWLQNSGVNKKISLNTKIFVDFVLHRVDICDSLSRSVHPCWRLKHLQSFFPLWKESPFWQLQFLWRKWSEQQQSCREASPWKRTDGREGAPIPNVCCPSLTDIISHWTVGLGHHAFICCPQQGEVLVQLRRIWDPDHIWFTV